MYMFLKMLHATLALVSIGGFILRGIWMLKGSALLQKKIVRIAPHIIDTLFLLSGIILVASLGFGMFGQAWLLTKIILLLVYIGLGTMALKGKTRQARIAAFIAAILVFVYILGIAVHKTPSGWFS